MANPYIGEIRLGAFNYAPSNWAFCDGSLLTIASNTALYSYIGTAFGGDGVTTFALPDLRSRVPVGQGGGFTFGVKSGVESVALTTSQVPAHSHALAAKSTQGNRSAIAGGFPAQGARSVYGATDGSTLATDSLQSTGGGAAHENRQPFLSVNFIISLTGVTPQ